MATAAQVESGGTGARRGTAFATLALCYLVAMLEGFDLQAAGVAAPKLAPAFGLTAGQLGLFLSISTFGLMVGAAIGGRLSDRFGRKTVLIGSVAAFGVLSVLNGLAPTYEVLLLARFLTGVGLGGALPNLVALVNENATKGNKSAFVGALYAGMPSGGAVVSLVSAGSTWQMIFILGGVLPLVMTPVLLRFLPESQELRAVKAADAAAPQRTSLVGALFANGRAAPTVTLWLSFFLALLAFYVLLSWLPTLMVSRGLPRPQAALVQVSFNICSAAASVATGLMMDRLSLKAMVLGTFGLAIAGLGLLYAAPVELAVSLVVGGLVGASISSTQSLLYALAPALYPTEVRGSGVGSAVSIGRIGSGVGPLVAGALLGGGAPPQLVVAVLVPVIAVSGLAALAVAFTRRPQSAA